MLANLLRPDILLSHTPKPQVLRAALREASVRDYGKDAGVRRIALELMPELMGGLKDYDAAMAPADRALEALAELAVADASAGVQRPEAFVPLELTALARDGRVWAGALLEEAGHAAQARAMGGAFKVHRSASGAAVYLAAADEAASSAAGGAGASDSAIIAAACASALSTAPGIQLMNFPASELPQPQHWAASLPPAAPVGSQPQVGRCLGVGAMTGAAVCPAAAGCAVCPGPAPAAAPPARTLAAAADESKVEGISYPARAELARICAYAGDGYNDLAAFYKGPPVLYVTKSGTTLRTQCPRLDRRTVSVPAGSKRQTLAHFLAAGAVADRQHVEAAAEGQPLVLWAINSVADEGLMTRLGRIIRPPGIAAADDSDGVAASRGREAVAMVKLSVLSWVLEHQARLRRKLGRKTKLKPDEKPCPAFSLLECAAAALIEVWWRVAASASVDLA